MALQHLLNFCKFDIRILVGSRRDYRIAMFLGDGSNRMSTVSKEGVVEVGDDETDGAASLAAKRPRQLIRAIAPVVRLRFVRGAQFLRRLELFR